MVLLRDGGYVIDRSLAGTSENVNALTNSRKSLERDLRDWGITNPRKASPMTSQNSIPATSNLARPVQSPLFQQATQEKVIHHLRTEVGAEPVFTTVRLDTLHPNPFQPRQRFPDLDIQELSESIKTHGLIHPVVIGDHDCRPGPIIICGERRVRAARRLGWTTIPAIHFRKVATEQLMALALEENLNRVDLCPFDLAGAFKRYLDQGGTLASLSALCRRDPDTIRRYLALLALPEVVIDAAIRAGLSFRRLRFIASLSSITAQLAAIRQFVEEPRAHHPETHRRKKGGNRKERRDGQPALPPDTSPTPLRTSVTITLGDRPATRFSFQIECFEKSFQPIELRLALLQVVGETYGDTTSPQEILRRMAADLFSVGVTADRIAIRSTHT